MPEPNPLAKLQVFLCHAHTDKPAVIQIYNRLAGLNWVRPWLDRIDLIPGQNWRVEIPKAVRRSEVVLVCLSKSSINKEGYVQKEIAYALDVAEEKPAGTIYLIPLRLEECEVPERLGIWHWVDYFEEDGFEQLLRGLRLRAESLGLDTVQPDPPIIVPAPPVSPPPKQNPSVQERIEPEITPVPSSAPPPAPPAPPEAPETEQERLLRELDDPRTTHQRRMEISDRLSKIGDPRPGTGVGPNGLPDIIFLPVAPGGSLKIENQTYRVEPFYIAKYLITCAQYQAFVDARDGYDNQEWWQDIQKPGLKAPYPDNLPGNPRNNISWYQSLAFTGWLNRRLQGWQLPHPGNPSGSPFIVGQNAQVRLPTEWEWQWAAQGGKAQREYPWGQWQESYANTYEAGLKRPIAVGMYPQGAAECGALDMSGNLWEWCLNKYSKKEPYRVLRGGSFRSSRDFAASSSRNYYLPFNDYFNFGLRLVVSAPIAPSDL